MTVRVEFLRQLTEGPPNIVSRCPYAEAENFQGTGFWVFFC